MYEFDKQPGRVVAESNLLSMRGHVLISQDLQRFDMVGLSSHACNQNSDAVCPGRALKIGTRSPHNGQKRGKNLYFDAKLLEEAILEASHQGLSLSAYFAETHKY